MVYQMYTLLMVYQTYTFPIVYQTYTLPMVYLVYLAIGIPNVYLVYLAKMLSKFIRHYFIYTSEFYQQKNFTQTEAKKSVNEH